MKLLLTSRCPDVVTCTGVMTIELLYNFNNNGHVDLTGDVNIIVVKGVYFRVKKLPPIRGYKSPIIILWMRKEKQVFSK